MTSDLLTVAGWANRTGHSLRLTFSPYTPDSHGYDFTGICTDGTWDVTVKPGKDGQDHTHFLADHLATAIAQMANDYHLPDVGFSLAVREARAWDRTVMHEV